jgi:hypothetical protein
MIPSTRKWTVSLVAAFSVPLLCATGAPAQEEVRVWWDKPVPSIEEISKGKLHVGDKLDKDNAQWVKEYVPEAFYRDIMNGAVWEIAPTTPGHRLVIPDLLKATKANLGKAVLRADGTLLMPDGKPWIGGFPFPEPKTGVEVMVNRQFTNADSKWGGNCILYWVNPAGESYKQTVLGQSGEIFMSARVCQEPKPYLPGYEGEMWRQLNIFTDPYDVRGLSILNIVYVDQSKYPDAWGYIPVLRRIQRFSSGQRYDSADGSDFRVGDWDTFADPLALWEFKLVGRKPFFSPLTGGDDENGDLRELVKGKYPKRARLELRDTYLVEAYPKDPSHIYSKKLLFVDAATWKSYLGQFYDKQGQLWLAFSLWYRRLTSECGNFPDLSWVSMQNYQTQGATLARCTGYLIDPPAELRKPDFFSLKYIASQGR